MRITVNICSYRYGHLVAHCLESVLGQTVKPDVIRVYDDGVGDCRHIKQLYPEVEFIERKGNLGIIANFNQALNRTDTERVMFLGADNWLALDAIEKLKDVEGDIVSYDGCIWGNGHNELWHLPNQPHGSALYNVKKAKEVGGYSASGNAHTEEDSVMFGKMREAGATFTHVSEPLFFYRRHRSNFNQ